MGKERSDKKEKKEKKEKRSDSEGVKKVKKDKKDKKDKKVSADLTDAVLEAIDQSAATKVEVVAKVNGDADVTAKVTEAIPVGALVPFANPLASEKEAKKSLKVVKKAAKNKTLKRGVKEVVKALRKTPSSQPSSAGVPNPPGVVIIAADISPMDVISHIPVLCEDVNIPYLYVTSRAELGAAGNTKRPTSVVLIQRERQKKKGADDEAEDPEWNETFKDLVKAVQKAGASVKV